MPAYQVPQSSTSRPLTFLMVQSSDHITGATGLSLTVTISKNGGTYAAPAGAISEIGNGLYKVAGNATDNGTLGPLWLHATATGADPSDTLYEVVAIDTQNAASMGLTNLATAAPAAATVAAAFADLARTGHTSTGSFGEAIAAIMTAATTDDVATAIIGKNLGFPGAVDRTVADGLQAAWAIVFADKVLTTTLLKVLAPDDVTILSSKILTLDVNGNPTAVS
jgi:hypothetical protein